MTTTTTMPKGLQYWTADEVAECLEYDRYLDKQASDALYARLWNFLSEAENPTPPGGDGSEGTVEYPCGRQGLANDDKTHHWWGRLTDAERGAISQAYEAHCSY